MHKPSAARQGDRFSPIFQQLQNSFDERRVELQQTSAGIDPEQVLVIEIIGNIENFANAVKKIPGLEWMGEVEAEEIVPDEDFYDEDKPEKALNGRLYLVMTNQQALTQMLSLWKQYQANTSMVFEWGLAKFRDVFLNLKDIRRWGIEDRLAELEMFEAWQENLKYDPNRNVRFEAELWYRGDVVKRNKGEGIVTDLIQQLGGRVISQCAVSSIAYHSVLGEIPANAALQIIKQPEVDLLKCEDIMFFRPTGQMAVGRETIDKEVVDGPVPVPDLPVGEPLVAILDGLPLENHRLLAERLIVDDPDEWGSEYPAIDRQHGTAMASLIVYGDLNDKSSPLNRPVYIRPIMKPAPWYQSPRPEHIPDDILFVDYIHGAVKRIMEGNEEEEAVAPTTKIINLSIGDQSRLFFQVMSPLARLLDWLSVKYKVLFVISSGNHSKPIHTGLSKNDFEALSPADKEALIVKKIYEDARHRRVMSPGESINGLTVGAYHHDDGPNGRVGHLIDVFQSGLPSPVSAFGAGYRRSVKPDFIVSGGRVLYSEIFSSGGIVLEFNDRRSAPGNQVAAPSDKAGELDKCQFVCGSSNSAALTSRAACICYDSLMGIFSEQSPETDFSIFGIAILKAILVHGCSWNEIGANLDTLLRTDENGSQIKNWISKWVGYGTPDIDKVLGCTDQRATLIGFGQLGDGDAHVYNLPLPPSLNAQREWRRFTVTLAWLSPIAATTQRYREAQLWFDFEDGTKSREKLKGKLRVSGIDSDSNATRQGTVQHEIFEGESAVVISDGDTLKIKVNCRKDARKIQNPIAYGLVVSLEVAEGVDLPVYNEIRNRITPTIEIRT